MVIVCAECCPKLALADKVAKLHYFKSCLDPTAVQQLESSGEYTERMSMTDRRERVSSGQLLYSK